ncbi:MAG: hypothetical protein ABJF04_03380 [Reichenbachiella sp.]|uniref:hypothetical protein n=1 Tax=Reichenbachiella sp. TaxID=2184521 RepID=UPI003264C127
MKSKFSSFVILFTLVGASCTNTSISEVMYLNADFENQNTSTNPVELFGDPVGDMMETSNADFTIESGSAVSGGQNGGKALIFEFPFSSNVTQPASHIDLVLNELDDDGKAVIVEMKLAKNFFSNPGGVINQSAKTSIIQFLLNNGDLITEVKLDGLNGNITAWPSKHLGKLNEGTLNSVEATVLRLIIDHENGNFRAGINTTPFGSALPFASSPNCEGQPTWCFKFDRIRFLYHSGLGVAGKLIVDDVTVRSFRSNSSP